MQAHKASHKHPYLTQPVQEHKIASIVNSNKPHSTHCATGRTLCKLHLPSSFLHADLNGDGVVDHVQVALGAASSSSGSSGGRDSRDAPLHHVSVKGHGTMSDCLALATSGIPPKDHAWAVSFCEGHHGLAEELMGDAHGQDEHVQVSFGCVSRGTGHRSSHSSSRSIGSIGSMQQGTAGMMHVAPCASTQGM